MVTFGDISTNLVLDASQSIRRNSADTAFETFTPLVISGTSNFIPKFNSSGDNIEDSSIEMIGGDLKCIME